MEWPGGSHGAVAQAHHQGRVSVEIRPRRWRLAGPRSAYCSSLGPLGAGTLPQPRYRRNDPPGGGPIRHHGVPPGFTPPNDQGTIRFAPIENRHGCEQGKGSPVMTLVSFAIAGEPRYGAVQEDEVIDLSVRIGSTYPTLLALLEADAPPEAAAGGSPSNSASTPRFRLGQCRGVLDAGEEQLPMARAVRTVAARAVGHRPGAAPAIPAPPAPQARARMADHGGLFAASCRAATSGPSGSRTVRVARGTCCAA
jgi:hypothetical protein